MSPSPQRLRLHRLPHRTLACERVSAVMASRSTVAGQARPPSNPRLQLTDGEVRGEYRLTSVTRQSRVGFGRDLGTVAGLLQFHYRVAASPPICRLRLRLHKL